MNKIGTCRVFLILLTFFGVVRAWGVSDVESVKVNCSVYGLLKDSQENQGITKGTLEVNQDLGGIEANSLM